MKRPTKAIIFGTLLAAGLSGLMYMNVGARHSHGGHHGRHRRPNRRHHGQYGWRNFWGHKTATIIPVEPVERYSWKDSADSMFWEIINNTPREIRVSSDSETTRIPSGGRTRIGRNRSFVFSVETDDGQVRNFETNNHFVEFYFGRRWTSPWREDSIKIRSHIEWPGAS